MLGPIAAIVVALLAAGCDTEGGLVSGSAPDAPRARAVVVDPVADAADDALDPPLRPGEMTVVFDARGFRLRASSVPPRRVLEALRAEAGFDLEIRGDVGLGPPITLRLSGASPDETLAAILGGIPHSLEYGPDPASGQRRLVAVRVGARPGPPVASPAPATGDLRAALPRPSEASRSARRVRHERTQREGIRNLSSGDPAVRIEAAAWLHADYRTIPLLGDTVLGDSSPAARAAAAETLGEAVDERDERDAASLLLQALDDSDPEVTLAALEALESVGDSTLIPDLGRLLDHPDSRVREQVVETIEWLED